jgi:hypothetical protein
MTCHAVRLALRHILMTKVNPLTDPAPIEILLAHALSGKSPGHCLLTSA